MPLSDDGVMIEQHVIDSFRMPVPLPGQVVRWWSEGVRGKNYMVAWVVSVSPRSIAIRTANGLSKPEVRHADDPKLQMNTDQREFGCWDFTDHYYSDKQREMDFERRLAEVEEKLQRLVVREASRGVEVGKVSIPVSAGQRPTVPPTAVLDVTERAAVMQPAPKAVAPAKPVMMLPTNSRQDVLAQIAKEVAEKGPLIEDSTFVPPSDPVHDDPFEDDDDEPLEDGSDIDSGDDSDNTEPYTAEQLAEFTEAQQQFRHIRNSEGNGVIELSKLRRQAAELGIKADRKWKKADFERAISDAKNG